CGRTLLFSDRASDRFILLGGRGDSLSADDRNNLVVFCEVLCYDATQRFLSTGFLSTGSRVIAFDLGPKFQLGRVVITRNALAAIPPEEVNDAIHRHSRADWGELDQHDLAENARCLKEGGRLFSIYRARNGVRFYVITESDRSVTNVELHISDLMLSLQKC